MPLWEVSQIPTSASAHSCPPAPCPLGLPCPRLLVHLTTVPGGLSAPFQSPLVEASPVSYHSQGPGLGLSLQPSRALLPAVPL